MRRGLTIGVIGLEMSMDVSKDCCGGRSATLGGICFWKGSLCNVEGSVVLVSVQDFSLAGGIAEMAG